MTTAAPPRRRIIPAARFRFDSPSVWIIIVAVRASSAMSVCVTLLLGYGCASVPQPGEEPRRRWAFDATDARADALWESAQEVLRREHLTLDRVDRRAGTITTRPEISKQFFEFWRHDAITARDVLESSLNPIRREVRVDINPDPEGEGVVMEIEVRKRRLSCEDRQFNNAGAAYQFFGSSLPTTLGREPRPATEDLWLDEGADPAFGHYLIERIATRFARKQGQTTAETDTGGSPPGS
jgi:hypothetical protein